MISHEEIAPPVIDAAALKPESLWYSHALALLAATALRDQGGMIMPIKLEQADFISFLPEGIRKEVDGRVEEHIHEAKILFIGAEDEDNAGLGQFTQAVKMIAAQSRGDFPLIVVYPETHMFAVAGIAESLRKLVEIPTITHLEKIGETPDLILEHLRNL